MSEIAAAAGSDKRYNRERPKQDGHRLARLKGVGRNSDTDVPNQANKLMEELVIADRR